MTYAWAGAPGRFIGPDERVLLVSGLLVRASTGLLRLRL